VLSCATPSATHTLLLESTPSGPIGVWRGIPTTAVSTPGTGVAPAAQIAFAASAAARPASNAATPPRHQADHGGLPARTWTYVSAAALRPSGASLRHKAAWDPPLRWCFPASSSPKRPPIFNSLTARSLPRRFGLGRRALDLSPARRGAGPTAGGLILAFFKQSAMPRLARRIALGPSVDAAETWRHQRANEPIRRADPGDCGPTGIPGRTGDRSPQ